MRNEGFKTKNLNIATHLYASGLKLSGLKRVNQEVFFEFSPKDKAEKLVDAYFAGTARLDPRELFARLNDLRDLIFSGGKHGQG